MKKLFLLFFAFVCYVYGFSQEKWLIDSLKMYIEESSETPEIIRTFEYQKNCLLENDTYYRLTNGIYKPIYNYFSEYDNEDNLNTITLNFYDNGNLQNINRSIYEYDNNKNLIHEKRQEYSYGKWKDTYEAQYIYNDNILNIEIKKETGYTYSEKTEYTYDENQNITIQKTSIVPDSPDGEIRIIQNISNNWSESILISDTTYNNGAAGIQGTMLREYYYDENFNLIRIISKMWDYNLYKPYSKYDYTYKGNSIETEIYSQYYDSRNKYYIQQKRIFEYDESFNKLSETYQDADLKNISKIIWEYDENSNAIKNYYQLFKNGVWINVKRSEDLMSFKYNSNSDEYSNYKHNSDTKSVMYGKMKYIRTSELNYSGFDNYFDNSSLNAYSHNGKLYIKSDFSDKINIYSIRGIMYSFKVNTGLNEFTLPTGIYIVKGKKIIIF